MENLSEMTVREWKVAAVEIPPRALKEGGEAKEGERAKEGRETKEGESAEEGADANQGYKRRININKCMAPGWPHTDSNATGHNAPFAFTKTTPEDGKGEPDPAFSAEQLDTLHKNNFIKPFQAFVVQTAAAQKLNKQINPDWEFGEPLLRVARREEGLAYNAFLTARAMAEARGWRDIVEDIDEVV